MTGIEIDAFGMADSVPTRSIEGAEGRFTARAIVLACGAVENARILLANNGRMGATFGNQSGLLGACYMVIPPFLRVVRSRTHAAIASFWARVMPPSAMFGRSLL